MVFRSTETNPYTNQCLEEALLQGKIQEHDTALFIWQNDPAVFIGRNQIPWHESRLAVMQEDRVALCRRISGGGSVFHDAKTISISYFSARSGFQKSILIDFLQEFLQALNVSTHSDDRHNLFLNDIPKHRETNQENRQRRKIAGSAFRVERHRVLHHVSLLYDCDEQTMWRYLRRYDGAAMQSHATRSQQNEVGGVAAYSKDTLEEFLEKLVQAARNFLGAPLQFLAADQIDAAQRAYKSSWAWLIGMTPKHQMALEFGDKPYWGVFHKGCIHACYNRLNGAIASHILEKQLFRSYYLNDDSGHPQNAENEIREMENYLGT